MTEQYDKAAQEWRQMARAAAVASTRTLAVFPSIAQRNPAKEAETWHRVVKIGFDAWRRVAARALRQTTDEAAGWHEITEQTTKAWRRAAAISTAAWDQAAETGTWDRAAVVDSWHQAATMTNEAWDYALETWRLTGTTE